MKNRKILIAAPVGLAVAMAATLSVADNNTECAGSNCAQTRINNLNYTCDSAGAACGSAGDCVCKNVNGGIWSDCYCLKPSVTRECTNGCGGGWVVKRVAGKVFEAGSVVEFKFVADSSNFLMWFDFGDVAEDGTLERADILRDDPDALQGSFAILIGGERGDRFAPIYMKSMKFEANCPLPIFGRQSLDNVVLSDGRSGDVAGFLDRETGELRWESSLVVRVNSTLFRDGIDMEIKPKLAPINADEGTYALHLSSYVTRPSSLTCGPADVAAPFEQLTFDDIKMFMESFGEGDKSADIAAPYGTLDERDMMEFVEMFSEGCVTP